jgi:hypothetical protein
LVRFAPNGEAVFIYEDSHPCSDLGKESIQRASYVEPNHAGLWIPDLSPLGGPRLEGHENREQALECEVKWLEENIIAF